MRFSLGFLLVFFLLPALQGQNGSRPAKYWVEFSDKKNTPYSLHRPAEYLSARALQRREKAGIAIDLSDLPVDPVYTRGLQQEGARIHLTSRWLNAAAVVADSATAARITRLPYVRRVAYIGKHLSIKNPPNRLPRPRTPLAQALNIPPDTGPLGYAALQNNLLNLYPMYEAGVRGSGIWIAVLDGGFTDTDVLNFFDSLAVNHRLFQGRDFVEGDQGVYESAQHGTSVLSVMGGNIPGYFVGTAPDATYFLIKTEDTGGEFPIEEANWVAGAEWADSVGVDIINASLGYTTFNDPSLNHSFSTLDGRTAIGSRGATIAAQKGMIVCNSAGNSGDEPWRHIGVPSDAQGVIAVGAVTYDGTRASFSSVGPTPDGRIKPDLVAPGAEVVVAGAPPAGLGLSSGTSLASPMLAGALAALWSAFPDKTAAELLKGVYASADQAQNPDNERGYGLPDFSKAWLTMAGFFEGERPNDARGALFSFRRSKGELALLLFDAISPDARFEVENWAGQPVKTGPIRFTRYRLPILRIAGLGDLPPGSYRIRWTEGGEVQHFLVSIS